MRRSLAALAVCFAMPVAAEAHVVDGSYRSDVTAQNCAEYAACGDQPEPSASGDGELGRIATCESGGDYATNTGNGYTGAYQFDDATWKAAGGSTSSAYLAPPREQDRIAKNWIARGNRGAWPNC